MAPKTLEAQYRKWCKEDDNDYEADLFEVFEEEEDMDELQEKEDPDLEGNDCMKFLSTLQQETVFLNPDHDPDSLPMEPRDLRLDNMVLGKHILQICDEHGPEAEVCKLSEKTDRLPATLLEVLINVTPHVTSRHSD